VDGENNLWRGGSDQARENLLIRRFLPSSGSTRISKRKNWVLKNIVRLKLPLPKINRYKLGKGGLGEDIQHTDKLSIRKKSAGKKNPGGTQGHLHRKPIGEKKGGKKRTAYPNREGRD